MSGRGSMLEYLVSEALLLSDIIGQAVFEVEEVDGIVILKGTVGSLQDRLMAENIARQQEGVVDVINNLRVVGFLPEELDENRLEAVR